jgi:hypothetical protein
MTMLTALVVGIVLVSTRTPEGRVVLRCLGAEMGFVGMISANNTIDGYA